MTAEIVSIDGRATRAEIDERVVSLLQQLLADAIDGRLEGIAVAVVANDGFIRCCWEGSTPTTSMLGTIERLKYDLLVAANNQD